MNRTAQKVKGGATAPPPGERLKTRPEYKGMIRFRCPEAMEEFLVREAGRTASDRSDVAREVFAAGMVAMERRACRPGRRRPARGR